MLGRVEGDRRIVLPVLAAVVGAHQRGSRRFVFAFLAVAADAAIDAHEQRAVGHQPAAEPAAAVLQRPRVHRDRVRSRSRRRRWSARHMCRASPASCSSTSSRRARRVIGPASRRPSGLMPRLKNPAIVRSTIRCRRRARRSRSPSCRSVPVYGSTTSGRSRCRRRRAERDITVWPLSWW